MDYDNRMIGVDIMKKAMIYICSYILTMVIVLNLFLTNTCFVLAEEYDDQTLVVSDNNLIEEIDLYEEEDLELKTDAQLEERLESDKSGTREILPDGTIVEYYDAGEIYSDKLLNPSIEYSQETYRNAYSEIAVALACRDESVSFQYQYPKDSTGTVAQDYYNAVKTAFADVYYSDMDMCGARMSTSASYSTRTSAGVTTLKVTMRFSYYDNPDAMVKAVKTAFHECYKDGMSNLEIALAFHDYLAVYNTYDYTYEKHSAYNALVDKTSVCQGYYEAYELLLSYAKIPNAAESGGNHIWNQVYIDGAWYNVDCTWDSTSYGTAEHDNFMVSDTVIRNNRHTIASQDNVCTSTKYDNASWFGNIDAMVGFVNASTAYYLYHTNDTLHFNVCNPLTGAKSTLFTLPARWVVRDGFTNYYLPVGHRLLNVNGIIYFNDVQHVYQLNPDGSLVVLYTCDARRAVIGIVNDGSTLKIGLRNPVIQMYEEDTIPIQARGYEETPSNIQKFVSRMYTVALGRDAEPTGLAYWTTRLKYQQIDGAGTAGGFILSTEFKNRNLSNNDYVDVLYRTFFDREGDPEGKEYWLNKLNSGRSREDILAGFVNSVEFANLCDTFDIARGTMNADGSTKYNPGVRSFVLRMYTKALNRKGETLGVEDWTNRIVSGRMSAEDVAKSFIFSEEFVNKNLSDEQFVETLYQTFMDRASDPVGKADWLNKLRNGDSRYSVLEGFSRSVEFSNILKSYGL